jgi:signal transduction histidine kinase
VTERKLTAPGTDRTVAFRAGILAVSLGLVVLVGYIDGRSSAYIAFSIFYIPPVVLATWFSGRLAGVAVAAAAALMGLAADLWTMHVSRIYPVTNMCFRLLLFSATALVVARLQEALERERALSEANREAAERLQAANDLKDALMRTVVDDIRAPLGSIFASAVTLRMAQRDLTSADAVELVGLIAEASSNLSALVQQLTEAERIDAATLPLNRDPAISA